MDKFNKSNQLWERAIKVIPSGTQTLSKGPDQFVRGSTPKYLSRGKGSHVWDVDGNEYIDYPMALGPILLGYGYPAVEDAVIKQIKDGTSFTLMHPLEVDVAELLVELIPCAEMVRFAKNGADVTSAAIKVARAFTGREHIAYCGYHGCQDWFAVTTPRNKGIPPIFGTFMHEFKYNQPETLEAIFGEHPEKISAVIMEQPGTEPKDNFLQQVKDIAHKNGALFILDEIVTGFRYALGGAQEYYKVVPDLACFGKGMANGFPISALVGKTEFMQQLEEIFFSMTFSGDTIGLAASKATIYELMNKPVIEYIWKQGEKLRTSLLEGAKAESISINLPGCGPRSSISFNDDNSKESLDLKALFMQETVKRGILFGGPIFTTYSHSDHDINRTIEASYEGFKVVRKALELGSVDGLLEGEKIGVVFRQRK